MPAGGGGVCGVGAGERDESARVVEHVGHDDAVADRVGLRLQQTFTAALAGQVEFWRVQQQNNIADYETKTSGYNMLGAALTYQGQLSSSDYTLYLRADNLLNVKAREHTSFIKDDVQLPGRNLTAGVKFSF